MKVYNLNVNAAKPTTQVVQMQQNSTGMLSVNVSNDGKYIRNLSCSVYDGDAEISATEHSFQLDVNDTAKTVKVNAYATPYETSATTFVGGSGQTRARPYTVLTIPVGEYSQDEFYPFVKYDTKFKPVNTWFSLTNPSINDANFTQIRYGVFNSQPKIQFYVGSTLLSPQEKIVVTNVLPLTRKATMYINAQLSTYTYPAIGYYVDYSKDLMIQPSMNAPCYAEFDMVAPLSAAVPEEPEAPAESTDGE